MITEKYENILDPLIRDIVLIVAQLRNKADIASGRKLYDICKHKITAVKTALTERQFDEHAIDDCIYALCALLDEVVLQCHQESQDYDDWAGSPLQVVFFNTNQAGNDFFNKVRNRIKEDRKEPIVLQCFDRVLGLGFQGKYLGREQSERETLILALREILRPFEDHDKSLVYYQSNENKFLPKKVGLVSLAILLILIFLGLYLFLNHRLDALVLSMINIR